MAYPTLNQNEIFAAMYNMIISQSVYVDNIRGGVTGLVDKAREEAGLFGDSKVYYATDALHSQPWGNDKEAENLLKIHRPPAPETQVITIDTFRQIPVTVDSYLTKRAFMDEYAYSQFTTVTLGWLRDTKRAYDATIYNTFIGTDQSLIGAQQAGVEFDENLGTPAQLIAERVANIITEMGDVVRDYNDYGFLRAYDAADVKIIWNADYVNRLRNIDLPTIFHNDELKKVFAGDVLPARYFGEVKDTATAKASNDGKLRSMIECDYATGANAECKHVFAGDLIPAGTAKVLTYNDNGTAKTVAAGILANEAYTPDASAICKIYTKLPVYMSAFEVSTNFYNPRSLTETHFLTFGHNKIQHFKNYPCITVREI